MPHSPRPTPAPGSVPGSTPDTTSGRTRGSVPTLKDVAKLAGCSTAVVSTVINNARGNTLASEAMRRRVHEAAMRLGYRPNFASRSLIRRSAQTIGVYVPPAPWAGIGMRYEAAIFQGIEQACRNHGYDVLAINLSGGGTPEACSHKFAEQRIDGLILLHVDDNDDDWVEPLLRQSPNIAAVNYYGSAPIDRVNFDDRRATALAVEHLVELGHRRIAFLGSYHMPLGPGSELRCDGYRGAMAHLDLPVNPRWVWDHRNSGLQPHPEAIAEKNDSIAGAMHLARLGPDRPTALVAYGDIMAVQAIRQLKAMGLACPRDISVVGIDGSDFCDLVSPQLTSVRQPFAHMGKQATERVLQRARSRDRMHADAPFVELIAPELIVRQSTSRTDR